MKLEHRPPALEGATKVMRTSCGKLYVTCNFIYDEDTGKSHAIEVFFNMGKSGSCQNSYLYSLAITLSQAARAGADMRVLAHKLLGIICPKPMPGEVSDTSINTSCADAAGKAIIHIIDNYDKENEWVPYKEDEIDFKKTPLVLDIQTNEKVIKEGDTLKGKDFAHTSKLMKDTLVGEVANPIDEQKRVKEAVMSGICPLCGGQLLKRSGCEECANPACDFSECG